MTLECSNNNIFILTLSYFPPNKRIEIDGENVELIKNIILDNNITILNLNNQNNVIRNICRMKLNLEKPIIINLMECDYRDISYWKKYNTWEDLIRIIEEK